MSQYNIAFDLNTNIECLNYFSIEKKKGFVFETVNHCEIKPIGSFLLDFLNVDFEDEEEFINFIAKYCFEDLLFKAVKDFKLNIGKYYKKQKLLITEHSLFELFPYLYEKYIDDFTYYQDTFIELTTCEKVYTDSSKLKAINDEFKAEFPDLFTDNSANVDLIGLKYRIDNLRLDFTMDDFYYFHKNLPLSKNIPYSFMSNDYLSLLFIDYKQLLYINKDEPIKRCANCDKFFIPKTLHDTKYCDRVFKGKKTCKEIGRELTYKESLAKEPLLKAYRSRYQTLSKQASEREKHEMYEYFKKEGPAMRKKFINREITSEEFQNWIDSTKFRKK